MASAGTYLYGRRMYETMAVRETDAALAAQSDLTARFAEVWQPADKVVHSTSLAAPSTANTRIERHFDPTAVHALRAAASRDLVVGGRTSPPRHSRPGSSTSSDCSSGRWSSVGAPPHCRPDCAPTWSSSTSTDSPTVSSISATPSGDYGLTTD
jgi:hypothetical protein